VPKLTLTYSGKDENAQWGYVTMSLANIECEDMLEGLAILHERLNAVGIPRIHQAAIKSTAGADMDALAETLRASDVFVTISC